MNRHIGPIAALAVLIVGAGAIASAAHAATIEILIEGMEFKTPLAQARVGDTVKWTNKDVVAHTATARNRDFEVSMKAGEAATLVVTKAGTFDYFCRYHPNMAAKLIVAP